MVTAGLVIFCLLYNELIDWLFRRGWEKDIVGWLVVGGNLAIILGFGYVYSWEAALVILTLFMPPGIIMLLGAARRNKWSKDEDRIEALKAADLAVGRITKITNGGK